MPIYERRNFIRMYNNEVEKTKMNQGSTKNIKGKPRKNMAEAFK